MRVPLTPVRLLALAMLCLSPSWGRASDCNRNGLDDADDLASGASRDCNTNGLPDECDSLTVVEYPASGAGIVAADLDGDGDLDLAAGTLLQNGGDGTFEPAGEVFPGQYAVLLAAGDLDRDGRVDLVASIGSGNELEGDRFTGQTYVFLNGGDWAFHAGQELASRRPSSFALGDIDGDGSLDAALLDPARAGRLLVVLRNDGRGGFERAFELAVERERSVALGDLDGDGDLDLTTEYRVFRNQGGGVWADPVPTGWSSDRLAATPYALALGDLDGDADLDLAVGEEKDLSVLWNRGDAVFERGVFSSHGLIQALVPADIDADGDLDLLTDWYPFLNAGDRVFHTGPFGVSNSLFFSGQSIVAADLDSDLDLDLVGGRGGNIGVALNHEGLSFGPSRDWDRNGVPDECELPCREDPLERVTDGFYFMASSDQGAVGDIIAVEVSLQVDDPRTDLSSIHAVGCYDSSVAELIGRPRYSDLWDRIAFFPEFVPLGGNPFFHRGPEASTLGFLLKTGVLRDSLSGLLPSTEPLHLATLFFRLKGKPGDFFDVRFCDEAFASYAIYQGFQLNCFSSYLSYVDSYIRSMRHVPGRVQVLPGEATRTELPDLPPDAKVYPLPPTPDTAEIVFELTGAAAAPGEKGVPVDLLVTSNFEFSGYTVGLTFPAAYLALTRIEEHIRPGIKNVDNAVGSLVLAMLDGHRRVGAERERVRIATLHFDVLEAAKQVEEILLRFEPVGRPAVSNWVYIRHLSASASNLPTTARVEPITLRHGRLALLPEAGLFLRGDANGDLALDLSDAQRTLGWLFLGSGPPRCPDAADANDDGAVDIADPVATLGFLFLGGAPLPPPSAAPGLDPTDDAIGCSPGS